MYDRNWIVKWKNPKNNNHTLLSTKWTFRPVNISPNTLTSAMDITSIAASISRSVSVRMSFSPTRPQQFTEYILFSTEIPRKRICIYYLFIFTTALTNLTRVASPSSRGAKRHASCTFGARRRKCNNLLLEGLCGNDKRVGVYS